MKKSLCSVLLLFILSGTAFAAGGKLVFNLYGNIMDLPANSVTGQDSQYKIYFEAKAAYMVRGNFYLWASHGYFPLRDAWTSWSSKASFAQDISVERTLAKRILSGGGGFFAGYFAKDQLAVRGEIGVCSIANDIDSTTSTIATNGFLFAETVRQAAIGVRGNLSFTYGLYKNVFGELSVGYMYAVKKLDDVRNNLGGLHLQLGLGINL
ncbi:MAG TPA: hypothetical protein VLQ89_01570 [Candidatus Binatia bacterium]|nr:hypothetical protein [Candidatus Binatia bacterium]